MKDKPKSTLMPLEEMKRQLGAVVQIPKQSRAKRSTAKRIADSKRAIGETRAALKTTNDTLAKRAAKKRERFLGCTALLRSTIWIIFSPTAP